MIGAGSLDRRVSIQRPEEVRDPQFNAVSMIWIDIAADAPASVKQTSGREFLDANQVLSERRAVFIIRWLPGLDTTCRIAWEGKDFDIRDIREIGRRRFLEIQAEHVE